MPAYASEIEWGRLPAAELGGGRRQARSSSIPMGATEQHGPHLPIMVDHRLAFEVACRAARIVAGRALVLVTPVIPFGMSEHHVARRHDHARLCHYGGRSRVRGRVGDSAGLSPGLRAQRPWRQRRAARDDRHGADGRHRLPIACATYWQLAENEIAAILERQDRVLHACEAETSMIWRSSQRRSRPRSCPVPRPAGAGTVGDCGRRIPASIAGASSAAARRTASSGMPARPAARRASACLRRPRRRSPRPSSMRRCGRRRSEPPHVAAGHRIIKTEPSWEIQPPFVPPPPSPRSTSTSQGKQVGFLMIPHSPHDDAWGVTRVPLAVIANGSGPTVDPRRRQPRRRVRGADHDLRADPRPRSRARCRAGSS